MSDASDNPAPAPSPGLIARLAAAISNSTPAPEPDAALNALQSSFDTLQADHTALTTAATQAAEKLESVQTELSTVQGNLDQTCGILAAVEAALPGVTNAASVSEFIQAQVAAKAQEQIAASGFKPNEAPAIDQSAGDEKVMSRAEFAKLNDLEKSDFSKSGGKLTD